MVAVLTRIRSRRYGRRSVPRIDQRDRGTLVTWSRRWQVRLVTAALFAWFAGVAAGGFGAYVGWQSAPALPPDAEATSMLQPAFVPGTSASPQRWDVIFDESPEYVDPPWVYAVLGTDEYVSGQVFFQFALPNDPRAKD